MINGSNRFYPPPRVVQVTPIYDTPLPDGPSSFSEHPELNLNQPSSIHGSRNGQTSIRIVNEPDPKSYEASSGRHGGIPYAYSPDRDQRSEPDPYDSEPGYSRSYFPDRPRRRQSFDYDDLSDDGRRRDNDYYSDYDRSSDYDRYPPHSDRSSLDNDRSSPQRHHQSLSQHNRSAHHEASPSHPNRSTHHDANPPHPNHSTHHDAGSPHPNRSTHHEPKGPSHVANAVSAVQRYLDHNRQAAHRNPFEHLKNLPEEVQRVLKAIPPSPQFRWSECTGERKAVCVSISFRRPNTAFPLLFVYRLELITSVRRTN